MKPGDHAALTNAHGAASDFARAKCRNGQGPPVGVIKELSASNILTEIEVNFIRRAGSFQNPQEAYATFLPSESSILCGKDEAEEVLALVRGAATAEGFQYEYTCNGRRDSELSWEKVELDEL